MQDEHDPKDEPVRDDSKLDAEAERELAGVPEHLRDQGDDGDDESEQGVAKLAETGFARDILSVSDNLSRAIDSIPEELREDGKFKGLVAGIEATQRELDRVFGQHGVTRVAAMGLPLDPNVHQAMMEIPNDEAEPGTVVQEMQAGYLIRDRLLRPALVGVAKKPD